jgi:predicted kinase
MSDQKIVIMVGPSGSGKSTVAKSILDNATEPTVILNRDKFREMLFGYTEVNISRYYSEPKDTIRQREAIVTRAFNTLFDLYIHKGYNVIVDNTNLNRKRDINPYRSYGLPITLAVMNTKKEECIIRNSKRERKVGEDVITKQYERFEPLREELLSLKAATIMNGRDYFAVFNYNLEKKER